MYVIKWPLFLWLALGAYNSRRAGVSAAIAMSVLIPFLICGACLIFRWRASMSTNQDFGGNGNPTSHNVYQRQQNNPMQHQITKSASFSDDEAVPKSSRLGTPQTKQRNPSSPHQGVYYTNEPLDMYTRNWPNKSTNYSTATCMSLTYFGFTTGCSVRKITKVKGCSSETIRI